MLGLVVMMSAVAVIYVRHLNRLAFMAADAQQRHRDELDIEWRRLMLERETWVMEHKLAVEARNRLKMKPPPPAEIITLKFARGGGQ